MAMKKCKECGEEISSSAKKCPKCGKDQRNFFMKHPVIYSIIILVILVTAFGSSTTNNSKTTLTTNDNSNASTTTSTTPSNPERKYNVGEIFESTIMAIKYVSVDDNFKGYSQYADVKAGYKIVKAEFEFENVSTTDKLASSYDFNCYADGYDCESFWNTDDAGFSANLSAGKKTKGSVYFSVPENATEINIEYQNNIFESQHVIFVVK